MVLFEIKKMLSKPMNKVALLILAAAVIFLTFQAICSVWYVDENGQTTKGIQAARHLRDVQNKWAGDVTAEVLTKVVRQNTAIRQSKEMQSENIQEANKAYAKTQGFSDIRDMISSAFSPFDSIDTYYRADTVKPEEAGMFYEKRIAGLKEWLNKDAGGEAFSQEKKQFLLQQYEKLQTPFYYEYVGGWQMLLAERYTPTVMIILALVIGFLVSGIFSDEFQLKADSIFFSTKLGRGKAVRSKISAGFAVITAVYWGVILLYSISVLLALGADGGACPIQIEFWKSYYSITCFQSYLLTMIGGYVGTLFVLTAVMLVSAKSRSTVLAITIPFVLLCFAPFLGRIALFSPITNLLPGQLLQLSIGFKYIDLYQIAGKVMGPIPILFILYLVLYLAMVPILHRVYRNA